MPEPWGETGREPREDNCRPKKGSGGGRGPVIPEVGTWGGHVPPGEAGEASLDPLCWSCGPYPCGMARGSILLREKSGGAGSSLCGIRTQGAPCSPEPSVTTHPVKDVCLGACQFYRVIGLASHRDGCQVFPRTQVWTQ